jgi:hypothetical protein
LWILTLHWMNSWQRFFPHSVVCLFTLFIVSFAMQESFSLLQSYLSVFVIIS